MANSDFTPGLSLPQVQEGFVWRSDIAISPPTLRNNVETRHTHQQQASVIPKHRASLRCDSHCEKKDTQSGYIGSPSEMLKCHQHSLLDEDGGSLHV